MTAQGPARWLLSPHAARELEEIWLYIATQGGVDRADRTLDRLRQRFQALAEQPLLGRARDDLRSGWRSTVVEPYVVYYRPTPAGVRILRVWHGRRDQNRLRRRQ